MADRLLGSDRALETWTVATFDVVTVGLVGVLAGHTSGVLGDALPDVGTIAGVLAFGYLWALVLVAMRWVLAEGGLCRDDGISLGQLLARGVAAAAFVGAAFVAGLGLAAGLVGLASGAEVLTVVLVTLFGAIGGTVGGALVGFVFGLLDVGLARATDVVVERLLD